MDRREALKLLTGGAALAVGATAIESSTAFADGGTAAFRPTCSTSGAQFTANGGGIYNNKLQIVITPGTTTCTTGWTGSQSAAVTAGPAGHDAFTPGGTNVDGVFTALATGANNFQIRGTDTGGDILNGTSVTVTIVIRRVCTNNANSARKAYCCTRFTRTATYNRGGTDDWGGNTTLTNFPAGSTPVTSGNGCTAP